MSTTHIVKQGEHLSAIAEQYGFHSYKKIWDFGPNAQLKSLRKNPNVLHPGDELVIPDKELREESRGTDARHKFQAPGEKLRLQLVLKDESSKPVSNVDCVLAVEAETVKLVTDGSGKLTKAIPKDGRKGRLIVKSDAVPIDLDVEIGIGELDPVEQVTGQIGRLNNLGYDAGKVQAPADQAAADQFQSAVEEFQCNMRLKVDGVCGPATQAKLKSEHGC